MADKNITTTIGFLAYLASKNAMVSLTKNVALDYTKQKIRVNAVCSRVNHTLMVNRLKDKN